MPYFIYRVSPDTRLELVGSFEDYKQAKRETKLMRAKQHANENHAIKIIFANNPAEAEQLLTTRRERPPSEDD